MIYLALEMAVFLILAALAGLVLGWWANYLRTKNNKVNLEEFVGEDLFAIKNRLDQCFDDNTKLRRDLKSSNQKLEKVSKPKSQNDSAPKSNLSDKIKVLMDDLQLRDDTILALEIELKSIRDS